MVYGSNYDVFVVVEVLLCEITCRGCTDDGNDDLDLAIAQRRDCRVVRGFHRFQPHVWGFFDQRLARCGQQREEKTRACADVQMPAKPLANVGDFTCDIIE